MRDGFSVWPRVLSLVLATACVPAEIPPVSPPPEPLVRYPYLQDVRHDAATLVWWTESPAPDTLVYWPTARGDTVRLAVAGRGLHREARLLDLAPEAEVGYRLASGSPVPTVREHRFRTAPAPGTPGSIKVLVFGDSGTGTMEQVRLAEGMDSVRADLILHTGDIAYPFGSDFDFTHRHFRVYQRLLATTPFFPVPGNHDVLTDEARPYREAFVMPGRTGAPKPFYYSFQWGRVHVVGLDTTHEEQDDPELDLTRDGAQRAWLVRDLEAAAANPEVDWIIVALHHPPFSSAKGLQGHGSYEELRDGLAPIFDRFGVDLVLTGHDHTYERTHPIRDGEVADNGAGTVYIVTGGGGGGQGFRRVSPDWFTAVSEVEYHFVTLEIDEAGIEIEARDTDGRVMDRHRISGRNPPIPPGSPR